MRNLIWMGDSLKMLKTFPEEVRKAVGFALFAVQNGEMPRTAKKLKGLPGVYEIKTDDRGDTFRTVYAVKLPTALYVLHAFQKKSKSGIATPKKEMDLIRKRLQQAEDHDRETES